MRPHTDLRSQALELLCRGSATGIAASRMIHGSSPVQRGHGMPEDRIRRHGCARKPSDVKPLDVPKLVERTKLSGYAFPRVPGYRSVILRHCGRRKSSVPRLGCDGDGVTAVHWRFNRQQTLPPALPWARQSHAAHRNPCSDRAQSFRASAQAGHLPSVSQRTVICRRLAVVAEADAGS